MARTRARRSTRHLAPAALAAAAALALTACSATGGPSGSPSADASGGGTVTLVTHDSFHLSDGLIEQFEADTGLTVTQVAPGDGGALVNQLILTKDAPLGDVVYGIDNTFASRAIDEGVLEPYTSQAPAAQDAAQYAPDASDSLTAVDLGDVCLNVDHAWFAEQGVPEPATLEDLTKPEYRDLTVVTNAATSSPGLAFLLATIGAFGEDGWQQYWTDLQANGLKVAEGWSDAYYTDFSGGGAGGPRPIALSYASSPPETVPEGGDAPTTGALLDTCFRQVEYAGVLAGAQNPEGARQLVDFLLSDAVQADIPGSMYMYPVSSAVDLPAEWAQWAPLSDQPYEVPLDDIAANRDTWVREWTDLVTG
ncbi:thiamine ABC transporter substrate-binding protein [Cellulomonas hominis]|uniref:Thiamine ABC transporter substrate-binding protein n=1 Tax=Cellulomonas hominis TaxID=156981 RepID=A0A511F842_9CELL|nr:thiamine ABC transporter substrate-binding protein [Cellulomonas hominis]MBB5473091.1 thiamine transport system substrate-binding protein [Cellulomonas hominis]NKY06633.1 thiamine ABC transporter substrate-binding protein [Cellulomonas hominis]GEL45481.1 thiamine ABC transporter substrate-binding protein [Cellulomonas hominis]